MSERALPILIKAQAGLEQVANAQGGLALTLIKLGRLREALPLQQTFQGYWEARDPQGGYAKTKPLVMALLHARLGDFAEARRQYRPVIQSYASDRRDGASARNIPTDLNPTEVGLMYELATFVRDAGETDDALQLFGFVARCTDAVIMRPYFEVYPDQELPEKIHADYATLLRHAGRDAEAEAQEAKAEKFRARRARMSRAR